MGTDFTLYCYTGVSVDKWITWQCNIVWWHCGLSSVYSQAVVVDNTMYISGCVGFDLSGNLVDGGVEPQANQVGRSLNNLFYSATFTKHDSHITTSILFSDGIAAFDKVITTMVIRPLDDRTYCARSAFIRLGLSRKLCDCSQDHFTAS